MNIINLEICEMLQLYTLRPCGRKSSLEKPHSLPQVHGNESYCPSSMPCSLTRIHSTKGSKDVFWIISIPGLCCLSRWKVITVDPWRMQELRAPVLSAIEKHPCIIYNSPSKSMFPPYSRILSIHSSASVDSGNHRSCSAVICTVEKKSTYKLTYAMQTHVVQGLTVISKAIKHLENNQLKYALTFCLHLHKQTNPVWIKAYELQVPWSSHVVGISDGPSIDDFHSSDRGKLKVTTYSISPHLVSTL